MLVAQFYRSSYQIHLFRLFHKHTINHAKPSEENDVLCAIEPLITVQVALSRKLIAVASPYHCFSLILMLVSNANVLGRVHTYLPRYIGGIFSSSKLFRQDQVYRAFARSLGVFTIRCEKLLEGWQSCQGLSESFSSSSYWAVPFRLGQSGSFQVLLLRVRSVMCPGIVEHTFGSYTDH